MSIVSYENLEAFGEIPKMLSPASDVPMWQQIDAGYQHGGGWNDFEGFTVSKTEGGKYRITYPGDPAHVEVGRIRFGSQQIILFDYDWVLWMSLNVDGDMVEHKIARID
jgi:hypothetical protein